MIQRQQTLWLLLAGIAAFFTFQYPFYTGTKLENNMSVVAEVEAGSNFFLLVLTGVLIVIALITILLFKDRKTQLKTAIAGLVLAIILLVLYFLEVGKFDKGNFALTSVLAILVPASFFMACRGIYKDQKLIKSLDKLR
jgi:glucan phosphoethanolaminetransferase (alkaline phosphatase superfamily)